MSGVVISQLHCIWLHFLALSLNHLILSICQYQVPVQYFGNPYTQRKPTTQICESPSVIYRTICSSLVQDQPLFVVCALTWSEDRKCSLV